uniref:Molybdenum cofactor synthesis 2 n=1 Tax=Gallus gallus TaxID=9031 RepID=A0A8V0YFX8_CHICK
MAECTHLFRNLSVFLPISSGLLSSGIKWFLLFGRSTCFLEISFWSCRQETKLPSSHQLVEAESVHVLLGTTRNNFEGKKVIHLEYEAYTSMAEMEIKKICRDVRQKWPSVKHIALHHRLGVVPVTEASVIIAVSSPHRAESLEAVTHCINTLKAIVPIWKKEIYEDEYSWKENKECFWTNSEK